MAVPIIWADRLYLVRNNIETSASIKDLIFGSEISFLDCLVCQIILSAVERKLITASLFSWSTSRLSATMLLTVRSLVVWSAGSMSMRTALSQSLTTELCSHWRKAWEMSSLMSWEQRLQKGDSDLKILESLLLVWEDVVEYSHQETCLFSPQSFSI